MPNRLHSTRIAVHDGNLAWAERLALAKDTTIKEILKWAVVKGLSQLAKEHELASERATMDSEMDAREKWNREHPVSAS